jgi:hypothetical protein
MSPVIFLGYSFGTYLAHDSAAYLIKHFNFHVSHLISIAGIPRSNLSQSMTYEEAPGETSLEKLTNLFLSIHGYIPKYFRSNGMNRIVGPFVEGERKQEPLPLLTSPPPLSPQMCFILRLGWDLIRRPSQLTLLGLLEVETRPLWRSSHGR